MSAAAELFPRTSVWLRPGVMLLPSLASDPMLTAELEAVVRSAPFRHMRTPGGQTMSVAMTSCGERGWVTDRKGYRYAETDPDSGHPWPTMPSRWRSLARTAAEQAGWPGFEPDACLVNRYEAGARMGLHRDEDETDFSQPIVSVSWGLPAVFLLGGATRRDARLSVPLQHGDVLVFGGPERLVYHGVKPVQAGSLPELAPLLRDCRINLTFRRAGP